MLLYVPHTKFRPCAALKEMGEKAHIVAIQDVEEKIYKEIKEVV